MGPMPVYTGLPQKQAGDLSASLMGMWSVTLCLIFPQLINSDVIPLKSPPSCPPISGSPVPGFCLAHSVLSQPAELFVTAKKF